MIGLNKDVITLSDKDCYTCYPLSRVISIVDDIQEKNKARIEESRENWLQQRKEEYWAEEERRQRDYERAPQGREDRIREQEEEEERQERYSEAKSLVCTGWGCQCPFCN